MTKKLSLYYDGYEALLNDYLNLEEFKILHKSTIHNKRLILILFFNFIYERNITHITQVKHSDIYDFLQYINNSYNSVRKSHASFVLRHFYFLFSALYLLGGIPLTSRNALANLLLLS